MPRFTGTKQRWRNFNSLRPTDPKPAQARTATVTRAKEPAQAKQARELAKATGPKFLPIHELAKKTINRLIARLEEEGPRLIEYVKGQVAKNSDQIEPSSYHDNLFTLNLADRSITYETRKDNGEIYYTNMSGKKDTKNEGVEIIANFNGGNKTFKKQTPQHRIKFEQKDNHKSLEIIGEKDLVYNLNDTYVSPIVVKDGKKIELGKSRRSRKKKYLRAPFTPKLLIASAVNLIKFLKDEGIYKEKSFTLTTKESFKNDYTKELTTSRSDWVGIKYVLSGIPSLPGKSDFTVQIKNPNEIYITLKYNPDRFISRSTCIKVTKEGNVEVVDNDIQWMNLQDEERNQKDIDYLQGALKEETKFFIDNWKQEINERESKIASQDSTELKTWNHLGLYESMSAPRMIEALKEEAELIKAALLKNKPDDKSHWIDRDFSAVQYDENASRSYEEATHQKEAQVTTNQEGDISHFIIKTSRKHEKPLEKLSEICHSRLGHRDTYQLFTGDEARDADLYDYAPMYKMEYRAGESGEVEIKKYNPEGLYITYKKDSEGKQSIRFNNESRLKSDYFSNHRSTPSTTIDELIHRLFNSRNMPDTEEAKEIQDTHLISLFEKLRISELEDKKLSTTQNTLAYEERDGNKVYKLYNRTYVNDESEADYTVVA